MDGTSDKTDLISRLVNWKFESAAQHVENLSVDDKELIKALAVIFSDSGWFEGQMGVIVGRLVNYLCEDLGRTLEHD